MFTTNTKFVLRSLPVRQRIASLPIIMVLFLTLFIPSSAQADQTDANHLTTLTGGVYVANRGQIARSRDFYSENPHWQDISGDLPIPFDNWGGITEFTIDPFDPLQRAWISLGSSKTWVGSLWMTENLDEAEPTWVEILSQEDILGMIGGKNLQVARVQTSPMQPGLIYIVVFRGDGAAGELYVGRSNNFGSTWTWGGPVGNASDRVVGFEVSEHVLDRLWVAAGANRKSRIYVSQNGGSTFSELAAFDTWWHAYDIFVPKESNADDAVIYLVIDGQNDWTRLMYSNDAGLSWTEITDPAHDVGPANDMVGLFYSDPLQLYYSATTCNGPWAFMTSLNGGQTWEQRYKTNLWWSSVWQHPHSGDLFTASAKATSDGSVVAMSNDGGYTWLDKTGDWFTAVGSPYLGQPGSCGGSAAVTIVDNNAMNQPWITVTSPVGGEKWLVEEEHEISWTSYSVNQIKIQYSQDAGVSWTIVEPSIDATSGHCLWRIPNITSTFCKVRISDASDATVNGESSLFTIKGWILARFVSGHYEKFAFDRHAWNFSNSDNSNSPPFNQPPYLINEPILWPNYWYRNFDYSGYPYNQDYSDWTLPPKNARSDDFPDWPLFVSAFGEYACYWNPPPGRVIFDVDATCYWRDVRDLLSGRQASGDPWNGSCAGFAISAAALFDDPSALKETFRHLNIGDIQYPYLVQFDDDIRQVINQLWIHQWGKYQWIDYAKNYLTRPTTTLREVREMLLNDERKTKYLIIITGDLLRMQNISAHAVLPYKVEVDANNRNIFWISVYDNNYPLKHAQHNITAIRIDLANDTWSYDFSGFNGANQYVYGLFLAGPGTRYVQNVILPTDFHKKTYHPQNSLFDRNAACSNWGVEDTNESDFVTLFYSNVDSVSIAHQQSRQVLQTTEYIPIVPITSTSVRPVGFFVPPGSYSVDLWAAADSALYFSVYSDSNRISIRQKNAKLRELQSFTIGNTFSVYNSNNMSQDIQLENSITHQDHKKVFAVDNYEVSKGDSLSFRNIDGNQFYIRNVGREKEYNLVVKKFSQTGLFIFEHPRIHNSSYSALNISPNWDDLENASVEITVDNNNDGSIDDTLTVENHAKAYHFNDRGWYMISLPVIPEDLSLSTLFPSATNLYTWDFDLKKYQRIQTLKAGLGYWISLPQAASELLRGTPLPHYIVTFPTAGWYMIGSVSQRVHFSDPMDDPDGSVISAYAWDAETQQYQSVTSLERGQAYWISVAQSCSLTVGQTNVDGKCSSRVMSQEQFVAIFGDIPAPPQTNTLVAEQQDIPNDFRLLQNYPNPFNASATIRFGVPQASRVTIQLYNMSGQQVMTLLDSYMQRGHHSVTVDASALPSGIYLYRLRAGNFSEMKKMILLR